MFKYYYNAYNFLKWIVLFPNEIQTNQHKRKNTMPTTTTNSKQYKQYSDGQLMKYREKKKITFN